MATTKKKITTTVVEPEVEPLSFDGEGRTPQEQQSMADFLSEFPQARSVKLYKLNPMTGRLAYVVRLPFEAFSEEVVQQQYGGGTYQARLHGEDGRAITSKMFDVVGSATPPGITTPATMDPMVKLVMDQNEKRADDFKTLLVAALGKDRPASSEDSLLKIITVLKELGLVGGNARDTGITPGEYAHGLVEQYEKGLQDGRRIENPDVERDPLSIALESIGAPLAQLFAAKAMQEQPGTVVVAPAPPPVVAAPSPPEQEVHTVAVNPPAWLKLVEPYLPLLWNAAARHMRPESVVPMIVDNLSDDVYDLLAVDAMTPGFVERTLAVLPPGFARSAKEWTTDFLTALMKELAEDEDGNIVGTIPPEPGNAVTDDAPMGDGEDAPTDA